MKLATLAGLVGLLAIGATSMGCGPGLSHRGQYAAQSPSASAPTDEVGTTTLTSAAAITPLRLTITTMPTLIIPAVNWDDEVDDDGNAIRASYSPYPGLQTWGDAPKPMSIEEKYGF